jgi:type II secretory pathway pseudopilin PulG
MELLTVVAIMAILMAMVFPVFKSAKENARKTSCISKLHTIAAALQQYQLDNHRYPRCLLGYYNAGKPMTSCTDGLYPEYVRSIKDFTCDSGPSNVDDQIIVDPPPSGSGKEKLKYYVGDSYDWTNATTVGSPFATYTTIWAFLPPPGSPLQYTVSDPPDTPDKQLRDFGRQLRFKNADSSSVVTWCMNHRGSGDIAEVLFLSGTVAQIGLDNMSPLVAAPDGNIMWRALP